MKRTFSFNDERRRKIHSTVIGQPPFITALSQLILQRYKMPSWLGTGSDQSRRNARPSASLVVRCIPLPKSPQLHYGLLASALAVLRNLGGAECRIVHPLR